jgi:hypothetical protein
MEFGFVHTTSFELGSDPSAVSLKVASLDESSAALSPFTL